MTVIMQPSTVKDAASTLTEEFKELIRLSNMRSINASSLIHSVTTNKISTFYVMLKFTSLFLQHTAATRSHLTPELVLRLVTPACPLWRAREIPFVDPYWAFYWPGGQATARYILDHKEIIRGRRVLDVGCGCGAGAIAAAAASAGQVLANDIDPFAEMATKMNAKINNVALETDTENYIGTSCDQFDIILIGDMFYDEEFGNILFPWLKQLTERDKTVLIGDPGRHGLTGRLQQLTMLARYDMPRESCDENNGFTETTVFKLNK